MLGGKQDVITRGRSFGDAELSSVLRHLCILERWEEMKEGSSESRGVLCSETIETFRS